MNLLIALTVATSAIGAVNFEDHEDNVLEPTTQQQGAQYATSGSWWKGNLHTHTFWSDGNDYPEMIVDWYKSRDYDFLALSDHNILSQGERWMDMSGGRGAGNPLVNYLKRFGDDWVSIGVMLMAVGLATVWW